MSRNDWERGEFTLPSADFARFRKAMQEADDRVKRAAFDRTQEFWKGLTRKQQTDPVAYSEALKKWDGERQVRRSDNRYNLGANNRHNFYEESEDLAYERLRGVVDTPHIYNPETKRYESAGPAKPRRVLAADMDYPTNRTTSFGQAGASYVFDREKRTVVYESGEGNRQVEDARSSTLGEAFFEELDKTRWTHGTGGAIIGNDEYNRETDYAGGGANYHSGAYGYLGIQEAPQQVRPFINAKGQRIGVDLKWGKYGNWVGKAVEVDLRGKPIKKTPQKRANGGQGRVQKGVPSGGQFAASQRGESGVRL